MIVKVGLFRIEPCRIGEFESVAADIRSAFSRGGIPGLRSFHMAPSVEDAGRWTVLVCWDSLGDHRGFVVSTEGSRQRELVAGFITGESNVFHLALDDVVRGLA